MSSGSRRGILRHSLAVAFIALLVAPMSASAYPYFGTREYLGPWAPGNDGAFGSEASIQTTDPGQNQIATGEIVLHRVVVQSRLGGALEAGLIQTGVYNSVDTSIDGPGCPPTGGTTWRHYAERRSYDAGRTSQTGYICERGGDQSPGEFHGYVVFRTIDGNWTWLFDNNPTATYYLGFSRGRPAAGGEINSVVRAGPTGVSRTRATYGIQAPWAAYLQPGLAGYHRTRQGDDLSVYPLNDGLWNWSSLTLPNFHACHNVSPC